VPADADCDYEAAIRYRLRVLEGHPYDDSAHFAPIASLLAARRHGEARRSNRRYRTRMQEIDVSTAPFPAAPYAGGAADLSRAGSHSVSRGAAPRHGICQMTIRLQNLQGGPK